MAMGWNPEIQEFSFEEWVSMGRPLDIKVERSDELIPLNPVGVEPTR